MNPSVDRSHDHDEVTKIKIPVVLDGTLAATIHNVIAETARLGILNDLIFCEHAVPKLNHFMEQIDKGLDRVYAKEEK